MRQFRSGMTPVWPHARERFHAQTRLQVDHAVPSPLTARRAGALKGRLRVPGDKSISHRALIFGALTVGETRISGLLEGEDVINTAKAMRALGATVERIGEGAWRVHGVGVGGFRAAAGRARFRQFRHRLPSGHGSGGGLSGHRHLRRRCQPAQAADAAHSRSRRVDRARAPSSATDGGRLPITLAGARDPIPIVYRTPVPSAQIKSAVLLAGLAAPGETIVIESEASRDHTERLLKHFGADIAVEADGAQGRKITLKGEPELAPAPVVVPADPSSAAFPMVAALIVPGSEVILDRRHDQSAAHRADRHAARDGGRHRGARRAQRRRRGDGGCPRPRHRHCGASRCRPRARRP